MVAGGGDHHIPGVPYRLGGQNQGIGKGTLLNTLAEGREVLISRGELIEIGGSFRLPEIIAKSGCVMREVGTTNRTHPSDYTSATGPETALIFKAHTSNYRIEGTSAKVNGKIVPLRYKLRNGDQVEVTTSKKRTPNRDWLAFVKTPKARNKIASFLNQEEKAKSLSLVVLSLIK